MSVTPPEPICVGVCKIKTTIVSFRIFQVIYPGVSVNHLGYMGILPVILHFRTQVQMVLHPDCGYTESKFGTLGTLLVRQVSHLEPSMMMTSLYCRIYRTNESL